MQILTTFAQLAAIWALAWVMGFAAMKALLPEDIEREYGALLAPCMGYLLVCFAGYTLSASLDISAPAATIAGMVLLAAAAIMVGVRPRWRPRISRLGPEIGRTLVLVLPMAAATLLPLFLFGAGEYLGAVNPDFFFGMLDNLYMSEGHLPVTTTLVRIWGTEYPIRRLAGDIALSARFGGDLWGIAIAQVLQVDVRAALALAIGFFMLNLPVTMYALVRIVMRFPEPAGRWTAWLMGISAPTALSYLFFYVGQNSALPALPLGLVCIYLMFMRPGWRTLLLCALLVNALFVTYFAMLPYVVAPGGLFALYLIYTKRLKLARALAMAGAILGVTVLVKLGMMGFTLEVLEAWGRAIGQTAHRQYYFDFLTEQYLPIFMGVYSYPSNPLLILWLGAAGSRILGVGIACCLLVACFVFARRWFREAREAAGRALIGSMLFIYGAVWAYYTLVEQFGYAVFKMTTWLQIAVVPFMAYGLHAVLGRPAPPGGVRHSGAAHIALATACVVYVVTNVISTGIYAYNGAGRNTRNGYIINHFGTAGNDDYFELAEAIPKVAKPGQSIGLLFTDSIRQFWTAYYLRDQRLSLLTHTQMPGDDEILPDPETRTVVDYFGNVELARNNYFHGAGDAFYLTWGKQDLNRDIVEPAFQGPPLWENPSFRLYPASAARDILYTGSGFYRLEYLQPVTTYWRPTVQRWTADGGEFFLLRPSAPGSQYRIAFDAIVGYEYPSESRTLEFWRDGKLWGEQVITSTARVISPPFEPRADVSRLVIAVRERNKPLPRQLGLWNSDLPADYRRMNLSMSNVRILPPGAPMPAAPRLAEKLPFLRWHDFAHSFNGLESDGWMGDRARITMGVPEGAQRVVISAMAAGNLGLKFPMEITAKVNGRVTKKKLEYATVFDLDLPLAPGERVVEISLEPPEAAFLDRAELTLRSKVIKRSLYLQTLEFR